uniref:Uncharacterized protein n=1 Tax=Picea glauca TaxID=3330 RepID=A0A101LV06_PICGL|nr:hypothetical protein ABT39_MTgene2211 [Picea glauca]QHR86640.1 hypothetical protein Q903MT_gene643 [Picea sitchensis]
MDPLSLTTLQNYLSLFLTSLAANSWPTLPPPTNPLSLSPSLPLPHVSLSFSPSFSPDASPFACQPITSSVANSRIDIRFYIISYNKRFNQSYLNRFHHRIFQ